MHTEIFTENRTVKPIPCRHCGTSFLPVTPTEEFCCTGCSYVYQLLHSEHLDSFYKLRDANPPVCPLPVRNLEESFELCDDPELIAKLSHDGREMVFFLEGLNCTACLWLLEKLPQLCTGLEWARVNMANSTIRVRRLENGSFAQAAQMLNRLGYRPHVLPGEDQADAMRKLENRRTMTRIGVAAFATGNIMILAVSLYGGADGILAEQFRWLTALLATPVLTWCSWPFYRSAWGALRSRHLNIDVPIVAALLAGVIMSIAGLLSQTDSVYFDSLSMLVFLLLSSRFWLKTVQQRTLDISHIEDHLLIGTVTRLTNGTSERISALSLKCGDQLLIQSNMTIPADGTVLSGSGFINTAVLTGEAEPLAVKERSRVEAGCRNLTGEWVMTVERPPAESRLAQILKDAKESSMSKPALVRRADRVGQYFVAVVFAIAFGLVIAFAGSDLQEGFSRALTLVIVTCPCVFGMAIPFSMSLAVKAAARRSIIIKDAEALERLTRMRSIYFDKTGTLTQGQLQVVHTDVITTDKCELAAINALEHNQSHPVARALIEAVIKFNLPIREAQDVKLLATGGIEGKIKGIMYSILPLGCTSGANSSQGIRSAYGLYRQSELLARFEVGDQVRAESTQLISWARSHGLTPHILSGDRDSVVQTCARQIGLSSSETISGATPEQKSEILKKAGGTSVMVGDGANDAAALAASGVGIAVRGSMEVSLRAADVYLLEPNLRSIQVLFHIAEKTRGAITRNLALSASFNLISGILAITGHMTPLWAAVLMPLSSLTVTLSAIATSNRLAKAKVEVK